MKVPKMQIEEENSTINTGANLTPSNRKSLKLVLYF